MYVINRTFVHLKVILPDLFAGVLSPSCSTEGVEIMHHRHLLCVGFHGAWSLDSDFADSPFWSHSLEPDQETSSHYACSAAAHTAMYAHCLKLSSI